MKFKSPTTESIHIGLLSGHTCHIPGIQDAPDGVDIHPMFHREALAKGAEPIGVPTAMPNPGAAPDRTAVITSALQVMLDGNDESDFKKDGTPDANSVSRRCGFKVPREEVDAIWKTLTETAT